MNNVYHSKTVPPRLQKTVPRERLFKLLDAVADHSVTWITSPAGSGKTTLVSDYLKARDIPVLWYNVDGSDADVAAFFYYMAEAAKKLRKGRKNPLHLFTPEYRQNLSVFARNYFESLFGRIPVHGAIVFDNYQDVPEDCEFHEVMRTGFRAVPEGLRIFVASRRTYPPPFVSLQVEGALAMVDWSDIRLTINEVREVIEQRSKSTISEQLAVQVHQKTQGWAAAVVLAMGQEEKSLTMDSVGYSSVLNYFAVEVFERFDAKTKRLLLGTALLPSISLESGAELAGVEDSLKILADLDRSHCFVNRYGTEYHCHPLFREFLLAKLEESVSREEMNTARRKAGSYLLKMGKTEESIDLLTAAGDWNMVMSAIFNNAYDFVTKGRNRTVEQWIGRIPGEISSSVPWLIYWSAFCKQHYAPGESCALFIRCFEMFNNSGDKKGTLCAWEGAVHSILFQGSNMKLYDAWIDWLDANLPRNVSYPSPQIEAAIASGMVGGLLARRIDRPDLKIWLQKAHTSAKPLSALAYMFLGEYKQWANVIDELENTAKSGDPFFTICWYYYKASLLNEIGTSSGSALDVVEEGLRLSKETGIVQWVPLIMAEGFFAALWANRLDRAREFLSMLESILKGPSSIVYVRYYSACALYSIMTGNITGAITFLEKARVCAVEVGFIPVEALTYIYSAFAFTEAGNFSEARKYIEACRALPVSSSKIIEYTRLVAEAALSLYEGARDKNDKICEAFALGRSEGYTTPYSWWMPSIMGRLCAAAIAADIEVEYAVQLIRTHAIIPVYERPEHLHKWPWPCHIRTFGGLEVRVNNELYSLNGSRRPLDLLKVLIAFGGEQVRQELIEDDLWPQSEGDTAHIAFKTNLSRLRKIVGEKTIQVKDGRVSLNPANAWLDVWALESLAGAVSDHLKRDPSGSPDEIERLAELVFEIYRGEFLASDDQPWVNRARERLSKRLANTIQKLIQVLNAMGKPKIAEQLYERATEIGIPEKSIRFRSP